MIVIVVTKSLHSMLHTSVMPAAKSHYELCQDATACMNRNQSSTGSLVASSPVEGI